MSEAITGVPAAKASVRTMPKLSPPSDGAHSTSPAKYMPYIIKIGDGVAGATVVNSFAQGVAALKAGKQIQYVGAGGSIVFNQWHNSTGAFEAAKYLKGNPVIVGSVSAAQIASLSR